MTIGSGGVNLMAIGAAPTVTAPSPGDAKAMRAQKLHEAALQFEAVLVRQLLKNIRLGGEDHGAGYGTMIVDSLATAVTSGGGLGFAKQIEELVARTYEQREGAGVEDGEPRQRPEP